MLDSDLSDKPSRVVLIVTSLAGLSVTYTMLLDDSLVRSLIRVAYPCSLGRWPFSWRL